MTDDVVTPDDMARQLGVSAKTVRAKLRERYGTLGPAETRWELDNEQIAYLREAFA